MLRRGRSRIRSRATSTMAEIESLLLASPSPARRIRQPLRYFLGDDPTVCWAKMNRDVSTRFASSRSECGVVVVYEIDHRTHMFIRHHYARSHSPRTISRDAYIRHGATRFVRVACGRSRRSLAAVSTCPPSPVAREATDFGRMAFAMGHDEPASSAITKTAGMA